MRIGMTTLVTVFLLGVAGIALGDRPVTTQPATPATGPSTAPSTAPSGAADAEAAVRLAREFLADQGVKVTKATAFPLPAPVADWWMVEYHTAGGLAVSPGPAVYVNKTTGEVTPQAPKGMPPRM